MPTRVFVRIPLPPSLSLPLFPSFSSPSLSPRPHTPLVPQVKGVTDCVSDMERNGAMNRQEVLGHDRQGRRYWFLCRRLFM